MEDMRMQRDVMCGKLNEYIDKTVAAEKRATAAESALAEAVAKARRSGFVAAVGALHNAMPTGFVETDSDKVIARVAAWVAEAESERDRLRAENAKLRYLAKRAHFICPECGPHVSTDEDGCCVTCGADCDKNPDTASADYEDA